MKSSRWSSSQLDTEAGTRERSDERRRLTHSCRGLRRSVTVDLDREVASRRRLLTKSKSEKTFALKKALPCVRRYGSTAVELTRFRGHSNALG